MLIKDADIVGYGPWLKFIWKGHLSNWFWRDRLTRRLVRQKAYGEMKNNYFFKYLPFVQNLHASDDIPVQWNPQEDKMFTLWLQGKENAPDIVKKCLESQQEAFGDKFICLDEKTMFDYIDLPDYILQKWKDKKIKPAHFADIIRIQLLCSHGGYWFDSTDLIIAPIPEVIKQASFFMYVTSPKVYIHMFVQNCFIRAKKGDPLIKMWRDLVFEYWKNEEKSADYFLVHMLFKFLVNNNEQAKSLFNKMPKIYQDGIHELWYDYGNLPYKKEYLDKMKKDAFFQKCSYRYLKGGVNKIIPGSTAAHLLF